MFAFPKGELLIHSKFPPETWSKKIVHKAGEAADVLPH